MGNLENLRNPREIQTEIELKTLNFWWLSLGAWECHDNFHGVPAWECLPGSACLGVPAWECLPGSVCLGVPAWECLTDLQARVSDRPARGCGARTIYAGGSNTTWT
jgi:hypothetical protein